MELLTPGQEVGEQGCNRDISHYLSLLCYFTLRSSKGKSNPGRLAGILSYETYSICSITIGVESSTPQQTEQIRILWQRLFALQDVCSSGESPSVWLHLKSAEYFPGQVLQENVLFEAPGFKISKTATGFQVQSDGSFLDLDLSSSRGVGYLADNFWGRPAQSQHSFFLRFFLMILPRHGLFGLHANGVVKDDLGCLIVGNSGHGKTTVTLSLIRQGWHYVSDDALMLHRVSPSIQVLAFRRWFACTQETMSCFPELSLAAGDVWRTQDGKRTVDLETIYPGQFTSHCKPRLLLFPRITEKSHSQLIPLDATRAMIALLEQSPGLVAGQPVVSRQLDVLQQLVNQARSYQLLLGRDVLYDPAAVDNLVKSTQ